MADDSKKNVIPESIVNIMVNDIFQKNNVNPDDIKNNISDDQKQMIKDMVEDLQEQVKDFNQGRHDTTHTEDET